MNKTIYSYNDYRQFLKEALFENNSVTESYILSLSQKLGFKSPRNLGMALVGYRTPSENLIKSITCYLSLNSNETKYLKLLIKKYKISCSEPTNENLKQSIEDQIKSYQNTIANKAVLDENQMSLIANWKSFAIHQALQMNESNFDPLRLHKIFKDKISLEEIFSTLTFLEQAHLIYHDHLEKKWVVSKKNITTTVDIPSDNIKKYHQSVLDRAKESLFEDEVSSRNFKSLVIKSKHENWLEIKNKIQDFFDSLEAEYDSVDGENVLQISMQSFHLTTLHKNELRDSI